VSIWKLLGWAVIVFLAWYLLTQPQAAGEAVHSLLDLLQQAANSIATAISAAVSHHS